MDQALIAGQNTVSHGPFVIHPSILVIPFPCSAQGKAWPSASSLPSRSSSTPCDCRRGGSPRFPGQRRSQVVHALPSELATCLTPVYVSLSSPSPPWVRHGRRLKQLALAGPIREFPSMDPKSTSPEACLPSLLPPRPLLREPHRPSRREPKLFRPPAIKAGRAPLRRRTPTSGHRFLRPIAQIDSR